MHNFTKFPILIISSPRCGSGAFGHALEQLYPKAVFFNEPNFGVDNRMLEFLDYAKSHDNYILKIMASSITSFPKDLQQKFFDGTFFTIKLKRSDIVGQIASHYVATKRSKWHYFAEDNVTDFEHSAIDIDIKDINESIKQIKYDIDLVNNLPPADAHYTYEEIKKNYPYQIPVVKTPYPTNYTEVLQAVSNRYITQRILIMGLPGSGKTTLAKALTEKINAAHFNADEVRNKFNDWDFSPEGRIRQSRRMRELADSSNSKFNIADFVAPLDEMRNNYGADWTIWVDTIREGRYADTNAMFQEPEKYDFRVTEQDADKWAEAIANNILDNRRRPVFDWKKETVQMLGRWQPWHDGHRALFERLIQKTGQVVIQIRDVQGWQGSNPFEVEKVKSFIRRDLDPLYQGQYEIQVVPNIVHIGWGRGVGYTAGEETFDESVTDINATKIRKELGLE